MAARASRVGREGKLSSLQEASGVKKLRETRDIAISDMIFAGDAIFPGGNDCPAKLAGVESIRVRDPQETKRVIEAICGRLET
jgi:hypothetical protein